MTVDQYSEAREVLDRFQEHLGIDGLILAGMNLVLTPEQDEHLRDANKIGGEMMGCHLPRIDCSPPTDLNVADNDRYVSFSVCVLKPGEHITFRDGWHAWNNDGFIGVAHD
jgi:hypothetical protein